MRVSVAGAGHPGCLCTGSSCQPGAATGYPAPLAPNRSPPSLSPSPGPDTWAAPQQKAPTSAGHQQHWSWIQQKVDTVCSPMFHLFIFLCFTTSFSSQLPPLLTYHNFKPISRQLPSVVPGWIFFSDPPTNLLQNLTSLTLPQLCKVESLTNLFICTTHSGSVLLTEL